LPLLGIINVPVLINTAHVAVAHEINTDHVAIVVSSLVSISTTGSVWKDCKEDIVPVYQLLIP